MITRLLVLGVFGCLGCSAFASDGLGDGLSSADSADTILADNRRKDRRDGRQDNRDDKQDCRQEEGRIGDDKRDCKQENRGEGDEVEGDNENQEDKEDPADV